MKYPLRLLTASFLGLMVNSCQLSKPPTPVVTGPDSGWTRAPIHFRATDPDGKPLYGYAGPIWSWGDSTGGDNPHAYAEPGTYVVTCVVVHAPDESAFPFGKATYSDPSLPCTTRIIEDTLTFPDTAATRIEVGGISVDRACILPDGSKLYVALGKADSVAVIDTRTNTIVSMIAVADSPTYCVASNNGDRVYVSSKTARSVSVIRTLDDSVIATISFSGAPGALDVLPSDSFLYVAHEDTGLISVIRTDDDSFVAEIWVGGPAACVAAEPEGRYVYAACGGKGGVAVIRTSDNNLAFTVAAGARPTDIVFSPSGETAYVACPADNGITLIRTADHSVLAQVKHDSMGLRAPARLDVLPNGQCLYTMCEDGYHVGILRRSDNYLLRNINIDPQYRGWRARVAVSHPDGSKVYLPTTAGVVVLGLRSDR